MPAATACAIGQLFPFRGHTEAGAGRERLGPNCAGGPSQRRRRPLGLRLAGLRLGFGLRRGGFLCGAGTPWTAGAPTSNFPVLRSTETASRIETPLRVAVL